MKKNMLVLLAVLLLAALTIQVAFADPPPDDPDNDGACNMRHSVWVPDGDQDTGPGNANGVDAGQRGMWLVHVNLPHGESIGGSNMSGVAVDHCG